MLKLALTVFFIFAGPAVALIMSSAVLLMSGCQKVVKFVLNSKLALKLGAFLNLKNHCAPQPDAD